MADYTLYNTRLNMYGNTNRERKINEYRDFLKSGLKSNFSLKKARLGGSVQDGDLIVISTDNEYVKKIISLDENTVFSLGMYVEFDGNVWLVSKVDHDKEVYLSGKMTYCPSELKFQDANGNVLTYPYFVETTRPLMSDDNVMVVSTTTKVIKLPFDNFTKDFFIGKRFMGETFSGTPQCWKINDLGIDKDFGLLSVTLEKDEYSPTNDSVEFGVCDYLKPTEVEPECGEKYCEIEYSGKPQIKIGGNFKTFTSVFYNEDCEIEADLQDLDIEWNIEIPSDITSYIVYEVIGDYGEKIKVKALNEYMLIDKKITLSVSSRNDAGCDLEITVVGLI